jgi:hypothetical protein
MRTTLNLDEGLLKELMDLTGAKTKTEALNQAISEMIRRKKKEKLKALSGKIQLDLDWEEMEKVELREQEKRLRKIRGHR